MLLRDWRLKHGLSLEALAARVRAATSGKCNRTVIRRWEAGVHLPHKAEMRVIYLLTGGQVTPNDFYDLPELPEQRAAA